MTGHISEFKVVFVKTKKEALGLYCSGCKDIIAGIHDNPFWDLSVTKRMHELGTGHKVRYVTLESKVRS